MEIKYAAMFASVQSGQETVTGLCQRLGISRKSYYKYRARFLAEGTAGLVPRSRRPAVEPGSDLAGNGGVDRPDSGGCWPGRVGTTGRCRSGTGCCGRVIDRRRGGRSTGCWSEPGW